MKTILAVLLGFCPKPLQGAVTWPTVTHYTWNFAFGQGTPSSATRDSLAIQLDNTDRLVPPDRMKIRLYGGDSTEPMYSRDWDGALDGLNGLLKYDENWDGPLAALWGRLELEMEIGTVKLHRLSLSIADGTTTYSTTITPDVQLVPEPRVGLLITATGCLVLRRRRGQ